MQMLGWVWRTDHRNTNMGAVNTRTFSLSDISLVLIVPSFIENRIPWKTTSTSEFTVHVVKLNEVHLLQSNRPPCLRLPPLPEVLLANEVEHVHHGKRAIVWHHDSITNHQMNCNKENHAITSLLPILSLQTLQHSQHLRAHIALEHERGVHCLNVPGSRIDPVLVQKLVSDEYTRLWVMLR